MRWIKHYAGVSRNSESLADLIRNTGFQGYGRYWVLLEYLTGLFEGESDSFRVPIETIRGLFRIRSWTELETFTDQLSTVRGLYIKRNGNVFEIKAPILLELQGRDFKKARTEREKTAPKNKNKEEEEDKEVEEEREQISEPAKAVRKTPPKISLLIPPDKKIEVRQDLFDMWEKEFGNEFLEQTFKKIGAYLLTKPSKTPKSAWDRFLNSWLHRDWEQQRKSKGGAFIQQSKAEQMMNHFGNLYSELNDEEKAV